MKIIISHDVDHISVWEHKTDLLLLKHVIRNFIEYGLGHTTTFEIMSRFRDIIKNKWQNLEALIEFNKENDVPATFFLGVKNGRGLSYSLRDAEFWMKKIIKEGFEIGVHGITFNEFNEIKKERDLFEKLSGLDRFGIRMHYLRFNHYTGALLNGANYLFDSSVYEMKSPFKIGSLWEFPLHVMDGRIICKNARWQNQTLTQSKETTKRVLEDCFNNNISYFNILFHDRYFSDSFRTWKEWYIWLIQYLRENGLTFINYSTAIEDLEGASS